MKTQDDAPKFTKDSPRIVTLDELRGIQHQIAKAEIAAHGFYLCMWKRCGESEAIPTRVVD